MYTLAFRRYTSRVFGIEIEAARARKAAEPGTSIAQGVGEALPFEARAFDVVFSHEVLEHVQDDRHAVEEMVRVAKPGGYLVIFVPNRLYPFETHGIYWRGEYYFGNKPLVNWLPNVLRRHLAPHVRAYTKRGLRRLFDDLPVQIKVHTQIYPGFDNVVARHPAFGRALRRLTYTMEHTPLRRFGLSHFLVLEVQRA
jgi:SAM-dependent methyltransferase